jgi:metal-responsive CopG/Arc/MetJ family transcriptional regulator
MATTTQSSIRFTEEDLTILDEVQRRTGLVSRSDALRYVLRQYAKAEGIEFAKATPKKKR